jgi:hypothetical protein
VHREDPSLGGVDQLERISHCYNNQTQTLQALVPVGMRLSVAGPCPRGDEAQRCRPLYQSVPVGVGGRTDARVPRGGRTDAGGSLLTRVTGSSTPRVGST